MFSFLFKKKAKKKNDKKDGIIEKFITEHKILIDLYIEILTLAKEYKFESLKPKLKEFEETLIQHINDEKKEIYNHLNKILDENKDSLLLKEIEKIKSDIIPIKKKINILNLKFRELNEENIQDFIVVFSYLKKPILNRIELEEKKLFLYFKKKAKR